MPTFPESFCGYRVAGGVAGSITWLPSDTIRVGAKVKLCGKEARSDIADICCVCLHETWHFVTSYELRRRKRFSVGNRKY